MNRIRRFGDRKKLSHNHLTSNIHFLYFSKKKDFPNTNSMTNNTSSSGNHGYKTSLFTPMSSLHGGHLGQHQQQQQQEPSVCAYCSLASHMSLTTLDCHVHRVCRKCFKLAMSAHNSAVATTTSSSSSMSSRKNSDSKCESQIKASPSDTDTNGSGDAKNTANSNISNSSNNSNNNNSSEASVSIASSSVSSSDDNNLDERFANSLAFKCKLCFLDPMASGNSGVTRNR